MASQKRPRWNLGLIPGALEQTVPPPSPPPIYRPKKSSTSASTLPPVSSEVEEEESEEEEEESEESEEEEEEEERRRRRYKGTKKQRTQKRRYGYKKEGLPSLNLNLGVIDDIVPQEKAPLPFTYYRPPASFTVLGHIETPDASSSLHHLSLTVDRQVPSISLLGINHPAPVDSLSFEVARQTANIPLLGITAPPGPIDNLSFKVERPTPVIPLLGNMAPPGPMDNLSFKVERPIPKILLLGNMGDASTSTPSLTLDVAGKTARFNLFNTYELSNLPRVPMLRLSATHVDSRLNTAIAAMHAMLAKREIEDFDRRTEAALKELDMRVSTETSVTVREQLRANVNRLQDLRRTKKDEIEESSRKIKDTLASIEEGARALVEPDEGDIPMLDPNDRNRLEESLLRSIELIRKLHDDIIKDQNDYLGLIERGAFPSQTITVAKEKLEHLKEKRAEKARERAAATAEVDKLHTQLEQLQHTIVNYHTSDEEKKEHDEKQAQLAELNRRKRTLAKEIRDLSHQMDESLRVISHHVCLSAHEAETFVQTFSNLVTLIDVSHLPPLSGVSQKVEKLRRLLQRFEQKKLLYRHLNLVHSFGQDIAKLEELKREHDIKFKGKTMEEILKLREGSEKNDSEEEVIGKIDKLKWQFEKLNSSAGKCHINRYLRRFKEIGMFFFTKKK